MLKNQNSSAARLCRLHNLFRVFAVVAFAFALHGSVTAQTGFIEICKQASGAGLENKIFGFTITGVSGTIEALAGQCSAPVSVPAGIAVIQELENGRTIEGGGTFGTFSGGFILTDVSLLRFDNSQPNPLISKNLAARTATLEVHSGGIQNNTSILFTNTYAVKSYVEICHNASAVTGGAATAATYTIAGLTGQFFVPPNSCSSPILINLPSTPGAPQVSGSIRVTQLSNPSFTLESAATEPAERFNSLTLGTGINNTNPDCLNAPDPLTVSGCTFNNAGGGYADVNVVEGGTVNETRVNFNNRVEPARLLKICKIAGAGVAVGAAFTFDFYVNGEPEIGAAPITVQAGEAANGGNCVFAQGQNAPFLNGISSFPANSRVTVVERAANQIVPAAITSAGTISDVNLSQRKATVAIVGGVTILTFTNTTTAPITAPTSAGTNVAVAPTTNLSLNFDSVSAAGNTTVTVVPPGETPPVPFGFALSGSSLVYEITTTAVSSGNITISFDVPDIADAAKCSQLRILHFIDGEWSAANNATPQYDAATRICKVSQTVTNLSAPAAARLAEFLQTNGNSSLFAVAQILAPSAASVTVGGRVMAESGRGIRNVKITLTDSNGNVRTTTTTAFGYYRFADVAAGETYIINAFSKRYTFSQPSQVLNITGDLTDIDFIGHSNFFSKQEK